MRYAKAPAAHWRETDQIQGSHGDPPRMSAFLDAGCKLDFYLWREQLDIRNFTFD
jgi:hypothetical protein